MRTLIALIGLAALGVGATYVVAGQQPGPAIEIHQPRALIGHAGAVEVSVEAPAGTLQSVAVGFEQSGSEIPLFSLSDPAGAAVTQETPDRIRITRPLGKRSVPQIAAGPGRVVVTASRRVLFGLRTIESRTVRDVQVRLEPPRLAVISTHHYINLGGAEMVVYRVTPPEVQSGVRVGERMYPGYMAAGAGIAGDPALKVAFFALLHDQDLNTPITAFARDEAGNETESQFAYQVFPKQFRRGRIEIDDTFLQRVVPAILQSSPELGASEADGQWLPAFLKINGDLRQLNAQEIASFASQTSPRILWEGAFRPLGNAQVEAGFADHRTYFYRGEEIDQQVHLGFDLAVTVNIPVAAANRGPVLYADYLGIYGNTVIVDHGMGVQSLYAHLSSFDVKAGDTVEKGQTLGRSGMTGLAGGDHLHFSMLVNGYPVNAVEWWDPHWIEDRVLRKLREAGGSAVATPTAAPEGRN